MKHFLTWVVANLILAITLSWTNSLTAQNYCDGGGAAHMVNTDVTWTTPQQFDGDVIIAPNTTLTIEGEVMMGKLCKIIVSPTARLIVDGGHIKAYDLCSNDIFWGG